MSDMEKLLGEQAQERLRETMRERDTAKQQALDYAKALHAEQRKCTEAINHLTNVLHWVEVGTEPMKSRSITEGNKFLESKDD